RVKPCEPVGNLRNIVYTDLVALMSNRAALAPVVWAAIGLTEPDVPHSLQPEQSLVHGRVRKPKSPSGEPMSDQPSRMQANKTDVTRWLPEWLLEEKKQKALTFLGSAATALAVGLWTAWHWYAAPQRPSLAINSVLDANPYSVREHDDSYTFYVPI